MAKSNLKAVPGTTDALLALLGEILRHVGTPHGRR